MIHRQTGGKIHGQTTRAWCSVLLILSGLLAISTPVPADAQPPETPSASASADSQPAESAPVESEPGQSDTAAEKSDATPAADTPTDTPTDTPAATSAGSNAGWWKPVAILCVGIAIVLGAIVLLRINAFIALITAAIVVSLLSPGDMTQSISRVAVAFGNTAGGIAIVIALAAVIGTCMLDSGAADRIVRTFVGTMGERRAPLALMGSGYVLAIPVFFDTVFYLLVPLARSLHRRTGKEYLKYILAIAAGGAITHTLVPPTPGPLLMAQTLNIDLGLMIMVGLLVALPAAIVGVVFADIASRIMQTPMRPLAGVVESEPLADEQLPPLWISVLPVLLPVLLISGNTMLSTLANMERAAQFRPADVTNWTALQEKLTAAAADEATPAEQRIAAALPDDVRPLLESVRSLTDAEQQRAIDGLNVVLLKLDLYDEAAFITVPLDPAARTLAKQDRARMPVASRERMNRLLLEGVLNEADPKPLAPLDWFTWKRQAADVSEVFGNANLALLLSTVIALLMLKWQRRLSRDDLAKVVETSLMSGGVIILITAGGGAFGAMLQQAQIGSAIEQIFGQSLRGTGSGIAFLVMGFLVASLLKVAQGSSTVAMIVGSSMMLALIGPDANLGYHPVYLATAIGGGSLVGSWMNDSGFWIFAKMGGLTEVEALKSWSIMLVMLGLTSFATSLVLAIVLPLV